ncbi:unnamed protein product [Arctogadus glacialis]
MATLPETEQAALLPSDRCTAGRSAVTESVVQHRDRIRGNGTGSEPPGQDPRHRDRVRDTGTGFGGPGQGPRHRDRVRGTGTGSETLGQGSVDRDRVRGTGTGSNKTGSAAPGEAPVPRDRVHQDRVRCRRTALECSASCRMAEIASTLCLPLKALNHIPDGPVGTPHLLPALNVEVTKRDISSDSSSVSHSAAGGRSRMKAEGPHGAGVSACQGGAAPENGTCVTHLDRGVFPPLSSTLALLVLVALMVGIVLVSLATFHLHKRKLRKRKIQRAQEEYERDSRDPEGAPEPPKHPPRATIVRPPGRDPSSRPPSSPGTGEDRSDSPPDVLDSGALREGEEHTLRAVVSS